MSSCPAHVCNVVVVIKNTVIISIIIIITIVTMMIITTVTVIIIIIIVISVIMSCIKQPSGGGDLEVSSRSVWFLVCCFLSSSEKLIRTHLKLQGRLIGLVVKASASRATDLDSIAAFAMDYFLGRVIPVT